MKLEVGCRVLALDDYGPANEGVLVGACLVALADGRVVTFAPRTQVAPPPRVGSVWRRPKLHVRIVNLSGLLAVEEEGRPGWPLYTGSLIGVARWLLECGFEPVEEKAA